MLEQLNIIIFHYLNYLAGKNHFIDLIIILTAKYGAFVFVFWLIYLWLRREKLRKISLLSAYSALLGLALNYIITLFYYHPRPFMLHLGTTLIHHVAETSFPSDTTTFMLSIAILFLYFRQTRISGIILFIIGFISGLCRVISGIHFPMDILGSLVVSIIASLIIYYNQKTFTPLNQWIIKIYQKIIHLFKPSV
ncbi:MAG TPA: undecaprenyl-diphosphatase [Candidatus Portnoybacteria bacterium]|nr:undecaprenyl-diphosphatase [Candidatus Portnoybacteria bacterium]